MTRGRTFTREFKLAVVRQVEQGERRPAQVCREHNLADGVLWRWRREYAERGEAAFTPPAADSTEGLERRIAELEQFCGQLALENAVLKGAQLGSVAERRAMIPALHAAFPAVSLRQMCRLLGVSRSSLYAGRDRVADANADAAVALRDAIERLVLTFPGYGYRRVTHALRRDGWVINTKRVRRVMREEALLCQLKRRFVVTTDSRHGFGGYPNLLADQVLTGPDQAWVADLTYIRLPTTFCYLAAILDAWSRRVVGWAVSSRIDTELTLAALERAIAERRPAPGLLHHSDHGVQYAATRYVERLAQIGAVVSMAAVGNPYQNALAESFFATLKREEVYLHEYRTLAEAEANLAHFLTAVYNHKRLHSRLGYRPPSEFEAVFGTRHTDDDDARFLEETQNPTLALVHG